MPEEGLGWDYRVPPPGQADLAQLANILDRSQSPRRPSLVINQHRAVFFCFLLEVDSPHMKNFLHHSMNSQSVVVISHSFALLVVFGDAVGAYFRVMRARQCCLNSSMNINIRVLDSPSSRWAKRPLIATTAAMIKMTSIQGHWTTMRTYLCAMLML